MRRHLKAMGILLAGMAVITVSVYGSYRLYVYIRSLNLDPAWDILIIVSPLLVIALLMVYFAIYFGIGPDDQTGEQRSQT